MNYWLKCGLIICLTPIVAALALCCVFGCITGLMWATSWIPLNRHVVDQVGVVLLIVILLAYGSVGAVALANWLDAKFFRRKV
jgi:hypothetical protein